MGGKKKSPFGLRDKDSLGKKYYSPSRREKGEKGVLYSPAMEKKKITVPSLRKGGFSALIERPRTSFAK